MEATEHIRSEEVQEVMGTPPGWMVRWGTTLVFLVLIGLGWLGWYFKYPDKVTAELRMTSLYPPVQVVAEESGFIEQIWVVDGQEVEAGERLALLATPADYEDINKLENDLQKLKDFDQEAFLSYEPDRSLSLGQLQGDYDNFLQMIEDLSFTKNTNYDRRATRRLKSQIREIQNSIDALEREWRQQNEARILAEKELERQKDSYTPDDTGVARMQAARQKLLEKNQAISRIEKEIADNRAEITELNTEIFAVQQGFQSGNMNKFRLLQQSLNELLVRIEDWKSRHVFRAPTSGTVSFYNIQQERQNVVKGERVFAILPKGADDKFFGEVLLPLAGSGKVEEGQRVVVKFDNYPFREFGMVVGRVEDKAQLPKEGGYAAKVAFPNGLRTNFGKELPFRQEMRGRAEIITEDKRFWERVLEKLINFSESI